MTMASPGFLPPHDPFGRTAPLAYELEVPVLGVPMRIRSNAAQAIAHAELTYGAWHGLPAHLVEPRAAACFDIVVHPRTDDMLAPLAYRRHGPVFMAAAGAVMVSVLLEADHAVAFVPAQALDQREWFTVNVLGLAWMLASRRRRVPLHAAVVEGASRALLLLADSGVGKSTLAYACGRAGLRVLTEDTVFVDAEGGTPRLWGALPCHWLSPDTAAVFPELADHPVVVRANGKSRIRVPVAGAPVLTSVAPVTAVLIVPGGDEPVLERLAGDTLADIVAADRTEGFDQYPEARPAVIAWLRRQPAYRCTRGADPRATAALLSALADEAPAVTPASTLLPLVTSIP
ncbi:hypothetical protein TBR22_A09490 [Luteitalea sp. TBR-22]|uniref:hypothetical protein n=1 Tax=Luteitalea sp. TBR-22 TaxID=2802971 RepID=UPI001EF4FA2B|nr:hypothetical protein [Luteitalea sp. TBR-22]BCS31745.2 hypothetical protein TBR22_A09490 [Luteitalea sp. TBR-22]